MKQTSFTAQELYAMAYLAKKPKMYGIPNVMQNIALQSVFDNLVAQNIADMDLDGQIALHPAYIDTVKTVCDCQKCLTVHVRTKDAREHSLIFYIYNADCFMVEVLQERYVFSKIDAQLMQAMVGQLFCIDQLPASGLEVVIPQISIAKAKRSCANGDYAQAARMLRQCGTPPELGNTIVDGLLGSSCYYGLVYMDMQSGICQRTDLSYISSDSALLSMEQTVANFRTCAVFKSVSSAHMHSAVKAVVDDFLQKGA